MYRFILLTAVAAAAAGCTNKQETPRGPVKGRVTLDGKPLSGATIVFESKGAGVSQTAALDDEGRYEFVNYAAVGLPAGSYKVTVTSGRFMAPGEEIPKVVVSTKEKAPPKKAAPTVPTKYTKAETSGLSAEVKPDDNPPFDFELKS